MDSKATTRFSHRLMKPLPTLNSKLKGNFYTNKGYRSTETQFK